MRPNPQENADLVTFTEEILNGKLHFILQWYLQEVKPYIQLRRFSVN